MKLFFRASILELGLMGLLVLILVVAIYLLRRSHHHLIRVEGAMWSVRDAEMLFGLLHRFHRILAHGRMARSQ
jgi:hypothetical protein